MSRSLLLIDGENLVCRFQEMLAAGATPAKEVRHIQDVFVWHHDFTTYLKQDFIVRVAFYTSAVGDDDRIKYLSDDISSTIFFPSGHGLKVVPQLFKKNIKSRKSKSVDIAITIDALRHTYLNHIDNLWLFSGDGDYLPVIKEVMQQGKRVIVGALSSGLSPDLPRSVDSFINLDMDLFANTNEEIKRILAKKQSTGGTTQRSSVLEASDSVRI